MSYPRSVYPSGLAAGTELSPSPSQGGSLITIAESAAVAPNDPVEQYDACIAGAITGVCVKAPSGAGADMVLQTSGIFSLPVVASDDGGTSAVVLGDALYIDSATAVVSKDATAGHVLFGYALSTLSGSASAANIPVKLKTV